MDSVLNVLKTVEKFEHLMECQQKKHAYFCYGNLIMVGYFNFRLTLTLATFLWPKSLFSYWLCDTWCTHIHKRVVFSPLFDVTFFFISTFSGYIFAFIYMKFYIFKMEERIRKAMKEYAVDNYKNFKLSQANSGEIRKEMKFKLKIFSYLLPINVYKAIVFFVSNRVFVNRHIFKSCSRADKNLKTNQWIRLGQILELVEIGFSYCLPFVFGSSLFAVFFALRLRGFGNLSIWLVFNAFASIFYQTIIIFFLVEMLVVVLTMCFKYLFQLKESNKMFHHVVNRIFRHSNENRYDNCLHPFFRQFLSQFLADHNRIVAQVRQEICNDKSVWMIFIWFYWFILINAYSLYRLCFLKTNPVITLITLLLIFASWVALFLPSYFLSLIHKHFYMQRKLLPKLIHNINESQCSRIKLKYWIFYEQLLAKKKRFGIIIPPNTIINFRTCSQFVFAYCGLFLYIYRINKHKDFIVHSI